MTMMDASHMIPLVATEWALEILSVGRGCRYTVRAVPCWMHGYTIDLSYGWSIRFLLLLSALTMFMAVM